MSDDKQAEIKKNYNSIPKWRWWCYGCTNSLHAHKSKSDQDSPCCGCIGYSNKPYEHWAINNMMCNHIIGNDNSDNQQREVPEAEQPEIDLEFARHMFLYGASTDPGGNAYWLQKAEIDRLVQNAVDHWECKAQQAKPGN